MQSPLQANPSRFGCFEHKTRFFGSSSCGKSSRISRYKRCNAVSVSVLKMKCAVATPALSVSGYYPYYDPIQTEIPPNRYDMNWYDGYSWVAMVYVLMFVAYKTNKTPGNTWTYYLPSGKRLHNDGKSQILIGKSTIDSRFQYVYQRVYPLHGMHIQVDLLPFCHSEGCRRKGTVACPDPSNAWVDSLKITHGTTKYMHLSSFIIVYHHLSSFIYLPTCTYLPIHLPTSAYCTYLPAITWLHG